ncbi:DUF4173 domain-containing protein [Nonomuraea sp. NN258]|uniref:DUF4153 domain-containing protein n=1 Tax=Nonomuraea antri TaxID=2730852 RepID=UPI001567EF94|nr:DUF4153 domain-containing protein [Nonomuraea antri]NRQ38027.1 DUF4173 domain-containing protein [Nonomuraea antri]
MRPLDFLGRIKVKLGIVIVLAVATAFVVNEVGLNSGFTRDVRIAVAVILALIMVQVLAMGMTKPLRQMARAAQTIAKGHYLLRVRATSRDEVGELARAFNAMAADLGEVDRQRRELIANVSHELRTPITALRAVLENVVDGVSAPDPETMRTALAQTERLGRLVAQLLDLSRLDSGVRLIEPDDVELAPLIEQAVREASLAREDVAIRPAVRAGLVVRADPDLLAQVLANLLDNAVRHSPAGGEVTVTATASGAGVRLAVADQGPGIPVAARGRVFERFSRLDAGRAADSGGAGLGLSIVKEIVELHGGSIRIDDGRAGCRMVVELPERTTMAEAPLGGEQDGVAPERVPQEQAVPVPEPALVAAPVAVAEVVPEPEPEPVPEPALERELQPAGAAAAPVAAPVMVSPGYVAAGVPMPGPPPPPSGGGLGHVIGGGAVGLLVGFLVGMFSAVMVSIVAGDGAALATLVLVTALFGAIGASMGASSARRRAEELHRYQSLHGQRGPQAMPQPGQPGPSQPGQPGTGQPGQGQPGQPGPGQPAQKAPGQAGGQPPVYVPPPLFPRPELPDTPRWLLPTVAGAGAFAAVALPEAEVGLGVVLVSLVMGLAAFPALLRRMTPWTVSLGLTAYWLISMAAVRDADYLVALLLLAGAGVGALAVSGAGLGWLGVIRGGASVLLALGPVPWFLAKPLKKLTAKRRILPGLAAIGITAVLLLVFGVLFASADPVFAGYLEHLTTAPDWADSATARIVVFVMIAVLLAALVLVALRPVVDPVGPEPKFSVSRSVWLVPLTAVNLLFASFVAVQIRMFFGGAEWVMRTAGLTFAEYARQGFFQLVVVSVFVLGIVAIASGMLKVVRTERWLLAAQLGVLCGLTMVVLVSALYRMETYTDAYGLSRLRLAVEATTWWLGGVFALVLIAGAVRLAGRGTGWLPRTVVLVTALSLGAFAVVNPDWQVARSQVEVRGLDRLDADYLDNLGAEAVPVLDRLPEPQRSCVLRDVVAGNGLGSPDPWNGWNLARAEAREILARRPVRTDVGCGPTIRPSSD